MKIKETLRAKEEKEFENYYTYEDAFECTSFDLFNDDTGRHF